jgi:EAL domain-containing protein (putative c-di-GMP-specific phosphodiesterase class I)
MHATPHPVPLKVLLVDDDDLVRLAYQRQLASEAQVEITAAASGDAAVALLQCEPFDVVVSDVMMPGMDGLALLRIVRAHDQDLPVILMTGVPLLASATEAVEFGAVRYLTKPIAPGLLGNAVTSAGARVREARSERQTVDGARSVALERETLSAAFDRALAGLHMDFQPIVSIQQQRIVAFEALLRTREPVLRNPARFLDAAEQLGQEHPLGRAIRAAVAHQLPALPEGTRAFVNLHPRDLSDPDLFAADAPLSGFAARVVLEITERRALEEIPDAPLRVAALRAMGYRIAIDDLGAGYAGLSAFAELHPQVVKLDMSLIRDLQLDPTKQKLVQAMIALSRELGLELVCEGVETAAERDALLALGADLLQGYLFARPGPGFGAVALGR